MTSTVTCPAWCTDHDAHTESDGSRSDCHNTARRSVDTSAALVEGPATLTAHLDQFLSLGHPDPVDDWHEQPKVNLVSDGCYMTLTPGQARALATALLELADLAEADR